MGYDHALLYAAEQHQTEDTRTIECGQYAALAAELCAFCRNHKNIQRLDTSYQKKSYVWQLPERLSADQIDRPDLLLLLS